MPTCKRMKLDPNHLQAYSSVAFSALTLLCNHPHQPSSEPDFITVTLSPWNNSPPPLPLAATILLPVSTNLAIPDTSLSVESCSTYPCVAVSLSKMFSRSSHAWHASEFPSFSGLNNIPLYVGWWDFKLSVTLYAFEPHLGNMFCCRIRDAGDPHGGTLSTWHVTSFLCFLSPPLSLFLFFHLSFILSLFFFLSFFSLPFSLSLPPSFPSFLPSNPSFFHRWDGERTWKFLFRLRSSSMHIEGCLEIGQIAVEAT